LRLKSLVRRRPSAPLIVSFVALFVALGGVGYAATQLPANSVGTAQLRNGSVGNWKLKSGAVGARKIINGSVGANKVLPSQVQLRLSSSCSSGAIAAVAQSGNITCTPTQPNEWGTSSSATTLGTGSTSVATQSLPGGSYLMMAYPHAVVSGAAGQHVEVDCTLSVPSVSSSTGVPSGPNTITKTMAVDLASGSQSQAGTIPLVLPVSLATPQTATVACTDTAAPATPAPTVAVDSTLNAIQTASNG